MRRAPGQVLPYLPNVSDKSHEVGESIGVTLPSASGGNGTLSYSLSGLLPGMSFASSSRRVTGSVSSTGSTTMTYRVRDADGDTDSVSFTWRITQADPAPLLPSIDDKSNQVGDSVNVTLPSASGTAPISYSLSGTLPSGLSFSPSSRTVTGAIGGSAKTYMGLSYRAANSAGSNTETFDWTIIGICYAKVGTVGYIIYNAKTKSECRHLWSTVWPPLDKAPPVLPSIDNRSDDVGASIDWELPAAATSGSEPVTYSVSGLPSDLSFSASSRRVSGTIGSISGSSKSYTVTYKATNSAGSDTQVFDWTVVCNNP